MYFSVNIAKFLRKPIFKNVCVQLLLICVERTSGVYVHILCTFILQKDAFARRVLKLFFKLLRRNLENIKL